jgi:hypothetical protein
MRFYSRIVFICNCCFIIAVILRLVEKSKRAKGNFDGAISFQPLESTLVILGYCAIFLNIAFMLACLYLLIRKRIQFIPRWAVLFNIFIFSLQVYYFFFSNF